MSQIISGIIAFTVGALWYVMSLSLNANNFGGGLGVGPVFFPRILSVMMMVLSVMHILFTLKNMKVKEKSKLVIYRISVYIMTACFAYLLLVSILGYVITTFLYVATVIFLITRKRSLKDILAAVLVTACLYGVFHLALKVPLPKGFFL